MFAARRVDFPPWVRDAGMAVAARHALSGSGFALAPDVELLAHACDDFAAPRRDRGVAPAKVLFASGGRGTDPVEHRIVDMELGMDVLAAGRDELDFGGLVQTMYSSPRQRRVSSIQNGSVIANRLPPKCVPT